MERLGSDWRIPLKKSHDSPDWLTVVIPLDLLLLAREHRIRLGLLEETASCLCLGEDQRMQMSHDLSIT